MDDEPENQPLVLRREIRGNQDMTNARIDGMSDRIDALPAKAEVAGPDTASSASTSTRVSRRSTNPSGRSGVK